MLTAIALILFVVELQIPNPFPIPGVKMGLANIVTVYVVYHYRPVEALLVVVARVLLGSFFSGNMMALMYSLSGGLLCFAGMLALRRIFPEGRLWACGALGAVFHNAGQIAVACLVAGWGMLWFFPFLLVSGCLAGAFTGGCAQLMMKRMANIPPFGKARGGGANKLESP